MDTLKGRHDSLCPPPVGACGRSLAEALASNSATGVTPISFGNPDGAQGLAAVKDVLVSLQLLSERQVRATETSEELATGDGVPMLVVRLGDTGFFGVRDSKSCSLAGQWGHVEVRCLEGLGAARPLRMTEAKPFACKAGKRATLVVIRAASRAAVIGAIDLTPTSDLNASVKRCPIACGHALISPPTPGRRRHVRSRAESEHKPGLDTGRSYSGAVRHAVGASLAP